MLGTSANAKALASQAGALVLEMQFYKAGLGAS